MAGLQGSDNMEADPPLDLNPRAFAELSVTDSFLNPQLASLETPNSNPNSLTPLQLALLGAKLLPQSQVPPRPKPPIPTEYFVYPRRSWRSMTKEHVRMHILDRYGARQRYIVAYKEWEEKHSKWVFGIYHLLRAVTKPERQEATPEAVNVRKRSAEHVEEPGAGTAPTDVMGDLDVDLATLLTTLQDGAEVDDLDRVKRWWFEVNKNDRPKRKTECVSTPVLYMLERQGKDTFGSRGPGSHERDGTPDVDLPHPAAQKIHSSMSSCVPPKSLSSQEESTMSESEEESDDEEDDGKSPPSWRIYSDQCICGYAGCHCRPWSRWWSKTFKMLTYVEYVDLPVSMSGVSGVPAAEGLPSGTPVRYTRVSVGERRELVKREPPVESLHKPWSPKSTKRAWCLKEHAKGTTITQLPYCSRVMVEQQGNQEGIRGALSAETAPKYIFETRLEDYFGNNPKIPHEYLWPSGRVLTQRANSSIPHSVVAILQWPARNRTLQLIAYIQYTFRLPSEIFFLAINLLDRFAASFPQVTTLSGVQWELVGFACLWLAWKYENHTSVPLLDDLIAHSGLIRLTRDQVTSAEWTVRNTIGLDLSYIGPLLSMRLALTAYKNTRETKYMARFLADVSATVRQLACHPAPRIGPIASQLACILTDQSLNDDACHYLDEAEPVTHGVAMHILAGVLNMPRPIEKPREQALFYKWTLPIVNDIAGWCQRTLDSVWPNESAEVTTPSFGAFLLELRAAARSQPFELGPGPSPEHALFEE